MGITKASTCVIHEEMEVDVGKGVVECLVVQFQLSITPLKSDVLCVHRYADVTVNIHRYRNRDARVGPQFIAEM